MGWIFYQEYLARLKSKFDFKEEALNEHLGVVYRFDMALGICHMSQSAHVMNFLKLYCTATQYPNLDGPEPCAEDCDMKYKGTWRVSMVTFSGWSCVRPDIQKSIEPLSRFPKTFIDNTSTITIASNPVQPQ